MKKLFSIVLMVLVAACMTGCSLHGGHGHGPANVGGEKMTLRVSVPASVFGGGAASIRSALRTKTAEREDMQVYFAGQVLGFEYEDEINKILYFYNIVSKALVQSEAAKDEKVELLVKKAGSDVTYASIKVDLPATFADDTGDTSSKETLAAIKISADDEGNITGAGTISVAQMIEYIGKAIEEIITKIAATESEKQEVEVTDGEETTTIKKEDQTGSDVTVVDTDVTVKDVKFTFKRISGLEFEESENGSEVKDGSYTIGSEIKSGDTIYRWATGTGIAVIPDVTMFEGNDESRALNTASATLKVTATKGEKTVTVNKYGEDETLAPYGVHVYTNNGIWIITLDGEVPLGELTFNFTSAVIPTVDGTTAYNWSSPTTFKVVVAEPEY